MAAQDATRPDCYGYFGCMPECRTDSCEHKRDCYFESYPDHTEDDWRYQQEIDGETDE